MPGIDSEELGVALTAALSRQLGADRAIVELERRPYSYRTSYELEQVHVVLDDGTSLDLIFKNLGEDGLHEGAQAAKPDFLREPMREIETYARVLAPARLGTATYYGASVEPERGRYWLFVEKVAGVELWQVGELETWKETARWLARLHARLGDGVHAGAIELPPQLLLYDEAFYRCWPERARRFAVARDLTAGDVAKIESLAERYERVVQRLLALPVTFIHGEFYASNVLVAGAPDAAVRVCPIDWEMAAVGPGLMDLAALVTGWSEESRGAVALAYREAAAPPLASAAEDAFFAALDLCRLHLAIRWLGWAPDWTPPEEHRQDWLGEAERLAEKIDA
jgi:aminoglycoside phosphotransferase (APT) family kinase protein